MAILATIVAGGQFNLATIVASGLLSANSQSLHFKLPGKNIGQLDNFLADIGLPSMREISSLLRLADGQGKLGTQLDKVCREVADHLAWRLAGFEILLLNLNVPHDGGPE